ncbi:MAG: arginine--tRNA ligase [bacterium]
MNIRHLLNQRFQTAFQQCGLAADTPAVIKPSSRPEFGHYQANGIMGAAKRRKMNPRQLANEVLSHLDLADIAEKVEIAGPGFINIHLKATWLADELNTLLASPRLNITSVTDENKQCIVADYSGPNLAKEMHVGHLRSTIIGDAVVRVLDFLGHKVIRQNHVGDWGTQFGMLIAHMLDQDNEQLNISLSDLEAFYRAAKIRFDNEPEFTAKARDYVVKLQAGDPICLQHWQQFIQISLHHCETVYQRLGVLLNYDDVHPESAYNNDLADIINELKTKQLAKQDQGAEVVFLEELGNKSGEPLPVIVQKSDGGYLYATTDLAALRYRYQQLKADRMLYFVDARQNLHLESVFLIAKKAQFVAENTDLAHFAFGTMMGQDGKPFKTRTGGTTKLIDLLDEAEQRAFELVSEKNPTLSEEERRTIAHYIGIGAVKYADLSKNRLSDYVFNWDNMLSFEGNTAPYLQYAYARIQSIFRKIENNMELSSNEITILNEPAEIQLAVKLLQLEDYLEAVAKEGTPHILCHYLYEVAGLFMSFYEACPILKAEAQIQTSRLGLAKATANTLKTGLNLLGINVMERM